MADAKTKRPQKIKCIENQAQKNMCEEVKSDVIRNCIVGWAIVGKECGKRMALTELRLSKSRCCTNCAAQSHEMVCERH